MKCPFCANNTTEVLESRIVDDGKAIRRRRECSSCKKRFTTFEKTKNTVLWVIKKDGRREAFDKEKIKKGILRALEKRSVSLDLVNEVVDDIEREMLRKESEEVSSKTIGKAVLNKLKKIDKVAWIRFASVYLGFDDLKDFEKMVEKE
ncbi:MAG: transcriptional regulator NrdR [bacterium]|nr:transcriptional regulator NrdR [bacterium]